MKKFWLVLLYEYTRQVFRRRFLLVILSVPAMLVAMALAAILSVSLSLDPLPVGYVDHAGLLVSPRQPGSLGGGMLDEVELVAFQSEAEARAAVDQGKIRGYYVLEQDFIQTGRARLVASKPLSAEARRSFNELLRLNLSSGQSAPVIKRITAGDQVIVRSADGLREMGEHGWISILAPALSGFLLLLVINTSGGYLLQALVEEKENRTLEVMITSVSPAQLMIGKIVGNLSVGLTQVGVWGLFGGISLLLGLSMFATSSLARELVQPLQLILLTLVPSFILIASLMAVAGASAVEAREAQQVAGLLTLPVILPYYFMLPIVQNPNGALANVLSYFPLTTAITLPLRAAVTSLPTWQVALNLGVLTLCAAGSLWLAGRAFRLGMLRYGKPLTLREILGIKKRETDPAAMQQAAK